MSILSASNPQWADDAQTTINLDILSDMAGAVQFSASPNDSEAHGRDIFARAIAGEFGVIAPLPAKPLATLKSEKIAQIDAAYSAAIQQDVSYMGTAFQADEDSQSILTKTLVTLNGAGSVPADWAWKDANNNMVPMTLAETNGLAMAMLARGWPEFQLRDARKKAVEAATTDAEVAAVAW